MPMCMLLITDMRELVRLLHDGDAYVHAYVYAYVCLCVCVCVCYLLLTCGSWCGCCTIEMPRPHEEAHGFTIHAQRSRDIA